MKNAAGGGIEARLKALALAGLVLAAGLGVWVVLRGWGEPKALARYQQLPAFQLLDAGNKPFDSASLAGKIWVASFVYTTCKSSCPMLTAQMRRLAKSLPEGPGFALVSFSVDPDKDSPRALADYARLSGAQDPRWSFLTGKKAALKSLVEGGFKLAAEPGERQSDARGEADIVHSSKLVLVDRRGFVRGYYDGLLSESVAALRQDAKRLAEEP